MTGKARLSATVDEHLLEAGRDAVAAGRSESLSAWVNEALQAHSDHHRRLQAMDEFLAAFQAEYGEITDEDIDAATRRARERAIVIRPKRRPTTKERRAS